MGFTPATSMPAYAFTLFTSAFLLFLVQPLIGKYILPWYGGSPSVWTTCMLVFQALLLAGYGYAHVISTRLAPRKQAWLHLALLLVSLACLPITPSESWKPGGGENPSLSIVLLLLASVGLPFFALSATAPLLQAWLGLSHPGRSPYVLYSLSNAGSLLALLAYPLWIEAAAGRGRQTLFWSLGFVVFAALCGTCAWRLRRTQAAGAAGATPADPGGEGAPPPKLPGLAVRAAWLLLPACASALLLSTTNVLCQDLAVIPFLWVLPLALYLLSFILAFAGEAWYSRLGFGSALVCGVVVALWILNEGVDGDITRQIAVYSGLLFVACVACHGELYRLRPATSHLTRYYFAISLGGCLGGAFVALLAPLIFSSYAEWSWSLGGCLFLFAFICLAGEGTMDQRSWRVFGLLLVLTVSLAVLNTAAWMGAAPNADPRAGGGVGFLVRLGRATGDDRLKFALLGSALAGWVGWRQLIKSTRFWHLLCSILLFAVLTLWACLAYRDSQFGKAGFVSQTRSFYGILSLVSYRPEKTEDRALILRHGRITHGMQFLEPGRLDQPTTYYAERSGVALLLKELNPGKPRRIGIVGLGTGTLACYGKDGDLMRFYEINPEVIRLAGTTFSFLSRSKARIETVLGDARLSMEKEIPQAYDVLALDAFSGDAIPVHLLTKEAFALYLRHLRPGGVVAVHISNRFLDLEPVLEKLRHHFGLHQVNVSHFTHPENRWDFGSFWVLLSSDAASLSGRALQDAAHRSDKKLKDVPLWTDDYASVLPLLR